MRHEQSTWTIGKKLTSGFLLIAVMTVALGLVGSSCLATARKDAEEIMQLAEDRETLGSVEALVYKLETAEDEFLLSGEPKYVEEHHKLAVRTTELLQTAQQRAVQAKLKVEAELVHKTIGELEDSVSVFQEIVEQVKLGKVDDAIRNSLTRSNQEAEDLTTALEAAIAESKRLADLDAQDATTNAQNATVFMTSTTILATMVALILGILLSRSISVPIRQVTEIMERVAQGQFGIAIE